MSDQPQHPQSPNPEQPNSAPQPSSSPVHAQSPQPGGVPQQPPGGPPLVNPAPQMPAHPEQSSAASGQPAPVHPASTAPAQGSSYAPAHPTQPPAGPAPQPASAGPTQPYVPPVGPPMPESVLRAKPVKKEPQIHEVVFVAYPKMLFVWPVMLAGVVFWFLQSVGVPTEVLGWCYVTLLGLTFLTLGIDLGRNVAVFWLAVILVFLFAGLWLQQYKSFTLFGDLFRMLANLNVHYDRGLGIAVTMVLLVPYSIMLVWARINDKWRITHNEFEHYAFGKMDDSLGRGAKTIRTSYPDVLELILGLAGTLVVYNATGTRELRRIPHVMFLPMVRKKLNKILERTAITTAEMEEEEDEDDAEHVGP